jgi:methionyl-tRNA formyltransferase
MKKKFKIALLSTIDNPLLSFFISSILNQDLEDIMVICDSKEISNKDRTIMHRRTNGAFSKINSLKNSIYEINNIKVPFYFVNNHNDDDTLDLIYDLSIDVLLNAGTPRKLSTLILKSVKFGVVNIHPGILPRYRGCSAVEWAIYNDEKVGNTAHFMTEGYDEGPIIKSEWYEFPINTDYKSIRIKVYRNGCILAGKVLRLIMDKKIKPNDAKPQDDKNANYWDPIPDDKFKRVQEIIDNGEYYYQRLRRV